jgi:hypothetical protein
VPNAPYIFEHNGPSMEHYYHNFIADISAALKMRLKTMKRLFTTNIDHSMTHDNMVSQCKDYTMWSWSSQKHVDPISMTRAEGVYFWDANDKK